MNIRSCITKSTLKKLNDKAIKRNYSRSLEPEMVDSLPSIFEPTGKEARFNVERDYTGCCALDCARLTI
jgi:hypothetical protein